MHFTSLRELLTEERVRTLKNVNLEKIHTLLPAQELQEPTNKYK